MLQRIAIFLLCILFLGTDVMGFSRIKILCNKNGEKIYLNGHLKRECQKNQILRFNVKPGSYQIDIRVNSKDGVYQYRKKVRIGDGVQKIIEPKLKPSYNEYHYYQVALESEDPDACDIYLQKYPSGKYRKKIMEIKAYLSAKQNFSNFDSFKKRYPNGRFLKKLKRYYAQNPLIVSLKGHNDSVMALAFSKEGDRLFSAGLDDKIIEWNPKRNIIAKTFTYPHKKIKRGKHISTLTLGSDEKVMYSNDTTGLRKWQLANGNSEHIGDIRPDKILTIDRNRLIICRQDRIDIWDAHNNHTLFTFSAPNGENSDIDACALTKDKKFLFFSMYAKKDMEDQVVEKFDIDRKRIVKTYRDDKFHAYNNVIAFTPDNRYFITAGADKYILIWDIKSGGIVKSFPQEERWIYTIAVHPSKGFMVIGSDQKYIHLIDTESGMPIKKIYHDSAVYDLKFTPGGEKLFGAMQNGKINVWYMGGYGKEYALQNLLNECKLGDLYKCNDYVLKGGKDKRTVKKAYLHAVRSIVRSNGGNIDFVNPKIYINNLKNIDRFMPDEDSYSVYTVKGIISSGKKLYVVIEMDFHDTNFTFGSPIYIEQNGRKTAYSKRFPEQKRIGNGLQKTDVVLIFDNFTLKNGRYKIFENDGTCYGCLNFVNGTIVDIL